MVAQLLTSGGIANFPEIFLSRYESSVAWIAIRDDG
jgi:hypothetical protein